MPGDNSPQPSPPDERVRQALHELRNAVHMLTCSARELRSGPLAGVDRAERQLLERMTERTRSMAELVDDLERASDELSGGGPASTRREITTSGGTDLDRRTLRYVEAATESEPVQPDEAPLPQRGDVVDDTYRIDDVIGSGGMGTVFRGRDVNLQRDVAIKVVSRRAWPNASARQRFLEEARAMARVRHPNVVEIHALGSYRSNPYFVMELINGTDLHDLIGRRRQPTHDEVVAIVDQLCQGASAIHRARTIHRDLKPSNVLVGPAFRVAITDMGLAQPLGASTQRMRGGTAGYSAPEVFHRDPDALDERVDVYSLGTIAYELLTGMQPFEGSDAHAIVARQRSGTFASIAEIRPELPEATVDVVEACLSPEADDRPRSADVLRRALLDSRAVIRERFAAARVVVADDDEDAREATTRLARELLPGCEVEDHPDGKQAAEAILRRPPTLVIADLDMPHMNGVELTAEIRSDPRTKEVAVLVITGVGGGRDWELLQRIGADAFLVKPVEPESLGVVARNLVRRRMGMESQSFPPPP